MAGSTGTDPGIEQPCEAVVETRREGIARMGRILGEDRAQPLTTGRSTMNTTHRPHRARKLAAALALATAAGVTAGCGTSGSPEPGADAEPSPDQQVQTPGAEATSAYTGPYDEDFRADLSSYAGQQVTLTGEIADLIPSRSALVLTSPENPDLDPLLVSARYAFPDAEEGSVVEVTGTVQTDFQARVVQDDPDDEAGFYDRHLGEPYLDQAGLGAAEPAEQ